MNVKLFWYWIAHHFDALQLNKRRPTTIFLLCSPYKCWDFLCVTLFFHLPLSSSRHHIERNTISSNCKNTSFFLKVKILDDIASPFLPLSHEIKMIIYQKIEIFNNVYLNKEPWAFICCTQSVWVINISGNCVISRH